MKIFVGVCFFCLFAIKLLKQWVDMIKKINNIASSIVKLVTKPLLTFALLRFTFNSISLNMLG